MLNKQHTQSHAKLLLAMPNDNLCAAVASGFASDSYDSL